MKNELYWKVILAGLFLFGKTHLCRPHSDLRSFSRDFIGKVGEELWVVEILYFFSKDRKNIRDLIYFLIAYNFNRF